MSDLITAVLMNATDPALLTAMTPAEGQGDAASSSTVLQDLPPEHPPEVDAATAAEHAAAQAAHQAAEADAAAVLERRAFIAAQPADVVNAAGLVNGMSEEQVFERLKAVAG